MSQYGFTGFPMRDSLPRGFSFVHFMRARYPRTPPQAPPPPPPAPRPAQTQAGADRTMAGSFDESATERTVSKTSTPGEGGVVRTDAEKQFSDGSRRIEVHRKHPDGTFEIETERRSTPDSEGFEKVRIWERTTLPDGTKSGTFRLFRVPAGSEMDWNGAGAQQFLVTSVDEALGPDGAPVAELTKAAPAETVADASESRGRDTVAARPRPVIPLAP